MSGCSRRSALRCGYAALAALMAALPVRSECIATAYRKGSEIPQYVVKGTQSLSPLWSSYAQSYPQSARLTDDPKTYGLRALADQCLVEVASTDVSGHDDSAKREQLIVQCPCGELTIGRTLRLIVYGYCVERFGGPPDFYSTLPYRHAEITLQKVF